MLPLDQLEFQGKLLFETPTYTSNTVSGVQIQPHQLNMQAQIKKRSLLTLTCLLRFNKFFLECSHLSLKIVTIKSHY